MTEKTKDKKPRVNAAGRRKDMINAAVLGYGTVGSGVVEVLEKNKDVIAERVGEELNVKYILDLRDFPGDPHEAKVVHDYNLILNDPEVSIICETMGGNEPAYTFSMQALKAGKSVCTSNKELVANHGAELIETARQHQCSYLFEASVGGGIPVIRPMNVSLTAEKIELINGILNGTTNYILTRMDEEGMDFATCLKEAQEKGYAERNPEADVEGYDACRKIAILASLMTGKTARYEEIYTEGISRITREDFLYAHAMHRSIKLLASVKEENGSYYAMVSPFLIDEKNPLYSVKDVFNAVFIRGNMLGDSMYYGKGAGKLPTASAVAADVIDCARNMGRHIGFLWKDEKLALESMDHAVRRFFVRVSEKGAGQAEKLLGAVERVDAGLAGECGLVTGPMTEKEFAEKVAGLEGFIGRIRLED